MAVKISTDARDDMLDALNTFIGTNAQIRFYDGTRPATGGGAITTQVLLAELTGNGTSFGAVTGGVLTANAVTGDTSANASGTATWFRLLTSGSTFVMDGDVVESPSSGDIVLNNNDFIAGGPVDIVSFVLTAPNAV